MYFTTTATWQKIFVFLSSLFQTVVSETFFDINFNRTLRPKRFLESSGSNTAESLARGPVVAVLLLYHVGDQQERLCQEMVMEMKYQRRRDWFKTKTLVSFVFDE